MEGLTPAEMRAILSKPRTKKTPHSTGGRFEGKVGTMRKSRKGVSRRLPNGKRFYVPSLEEWQSVGLCR